MVEDNAMLRGLILDVLRSGGRFRAYGAGSIADAEALLAHPDVYFDAILLDTMLPDGDGHALCRKLRDAGFKRPIVILTGRSGAKAEQLSLDRGATEHLTKPISMAYLLGRLSALTAASEGSGQAMERLGQSGICLGSAE